MSLDSSKFFVVGTPIGNLEDLTLRAVRILKEVDRIFCEDTRHSLKLLRHLGISKPLESAPYFKERAATEKIIRHLKDGQSVAYISDAGMPGLSDPGAHLVAGIRRAGFPVEVISGVSSLTHFIGGLGRELESFRFIGFLPPRAKDREVLLGREVSEPTIFFESPHRIESTLEILKNLVPEADLACAKELSKISEAFYFGTPEEVINQVKSYKGEWIGCLFPPPKSDRTKR